MRRSAVTVAALTGVLLAGCSIDDEVATRLEATVEAFSPPQVWEEVHLTDGPHADDGFPRLYDDGPLCFSEDCVHAVRQWLLADGAQVDLERLETTIAATPDWQVAYRPDCVLGDDAVDQRLIDQPGCVWEADVGDRFVLVGIDRFNDVSPWRLRTSVRMDDHVRREQDSPVVAVTRRELVADLINLADRFEAPDGWRLIDDTVVAEPPDCSQRDCLTVLRTWFDAELDAALVRGLVRAAGWQLVEDPASCVPGDDERGLQVDCRFVAHTADAEAVVEATAVGQIYEVRLTVSDR